MKRILSLMLALLVVLPVSLAMTQEEIDEELNEAIQTPEEYQDLTIGNKVENACDILGIEYVEGEDPLMSSVFRGIFHTDGWKAFLALRSGIVYKYQKWVQMRICYPNGDCETKLL